MCLSKISLPIYKILEVEECPVANGTFGYLLSIKHFWVQSFFFQIIADEISISIKGANI